MWYNIKMVMVIQHLVLDHRKTYMREVATMLGVFIGLVFKTTMFLVYEAFWTFKTLVSALEGMANLERHHLYVPSFTVAEDERLNSSLNIALGRCDAGNHVFKTL